jgi:hypothetical protein
MENKWKKLFSRPFLWLVLGREKINK